MVEPLYTTFKSFKQELAKRLQEKIEVFEVCPSESIREVKLQQFRSYLRVIKMIFQRYEDAYEQLKQAAKKFTGDTAEVTKDLLEHGSVLLAYDASVAMVESQVELILLTEERETQKQREERLLEARIAEERRKTDAAIAAQTSAPNLVPFREGRNQQQLSVRIPELDAPVYDGKLSEYQSFMDAFEACIGSQQSIPNIVKFTYLKSKLKPGSMAAKAIEGLPVTNESYERALKRIKDRFGDKTAIERHHYNAILDAPSIENKTTALREFCDMIEANLNALETLDEDVTEAVALVKAIEKKLPRKVLQELYDKNDCSKFTLETLRKAFQKYVSRRETIEMVTSSSANPTGNWSSAFGHTKTKSFNTSTYPKTTTHQKTTTSTLVSSSSKVGNSSLEKRPGRIFNCVYCVGNHWPTDCSKVKTLADRKKKLMTDNRCTNCLSNDHNITNCRSRKSCYHCSKKNVISWHHQSICPDAFLSQTTTMVVSESSIPMTDSNVILASEVTLLSKTSGTGVLMQTAMALICSSPDSENLFRAHVVLDTASQRSYITSSFAKKLQLTNGRKEKLMVHTFGGQSPTAVDTYNVSLFVTTKDDELVKLDVNITDIITGFTHRPAIQLKADELKVIKQYHLADKIPFEADTRPIDLLIGSDYYTQIVTFNKVDINNSLCLISSRLGWILTGQYQTRAIPRHAEMNLLASITTLLSPLRPYRLEVSNQNDLPNKNFDPQQYWSLEHIGIIDKKDDVHDEMALQNFNNTIQFKNNRYYVKWPWIEEEFILPTNFKLSLGRLNSLIKRYKNMPNVFHQYQEILDAQLEKGIIEKVEEENKSDSRKHYIPHHAVITPDKATTKLRIVYDGSAKSKKENMSINECLYRGPIILDSVVDLLIRFQLNKVAIVSDIEKAFLQVGLQEEDRDVTRFLWLKDPIKLTTENNLQIYRFSRVPFGINSSPFLLSATLVYHLKRFSSETASNILKNIYVDNIITGVLSVDQAFEFYKEAKHIFSSASMNLREWNSNDRSFLDSIPQNDRSKDSHCKILGMHWDTTSDQMSIKVPKFALATTITKRMVLQYISSIFDPLGLLCPTLLLAKIFLQALWQKKYSWDDPLTAAQKEEWSKIVTTIDPLSEFRFNRFIAMVNEPDAHYELHAFCDASYVAYGCCIYLRIVSAKSVFSRLIFAKSRLTPISPKQTIPRLELIAAEIGSKCLKLVLNALQDSLPISQCFLWSDSTCVIHWLQNLLVLYVPGQQNPADVASRGIPATELFSSTSIWWQGPSFLNADQSKWPSQEIFNKNQLESFEFESKIFASFSLVVSEGAKAVKEEIRESPLLKRYSNLNKLLRITSYILRFGNPASSKFITSDELKKAINQWIRYVQNAHFVDVIKIVQEDVSKHESKKRRHQFCNLGLFMEDGILRCRSRLVSSELPNETKFPILLPKNSYLTTLIIADIHQRYMHVGVSHTLAAVRKNYWIPSGRSVVYSFIKACRICKRQDGGPYKAPSFPALPETRVTESVPFTFTGLDYFGPLYIKKLEGMSKGKVWGCLFTCLSTRAIHLEVVDDMSAEEFLLAMRRFIARRGKPTTIYSDNGTQFKLVSTVVQKFWQSIPITSSVIDYLNRENIAWKFITNRAPWKGGFYERLIRIVKQCLKKSVGKVTLSFVQLQTVLYEIEAVINSRPLCYVGSDFESGFYLTPGHFLSQNVFTGTPNVDLDKLKDEEYYENLSSKDRLLQIWKNGLRQLELFWKYWQNDYLINLQERSQIELKQPRILSHKFPQTGDVVLVKNAGPRGSWLLGRIIELLPSSDSKVRSAKIKLSTGSTTIRATSHLYPLECNEENLQAYNKIPTDQLNEETRPIRIKRRAAVTATKKIRHVYSEENNSD